jgi:hypothetical protein
MYSNGPSLILHPALCGAGAENFIFLLRAPEQEKQKESTIGRAEKEDHKIKAAE